MKRSRWTMAGVILAAATVGYLIAPRVAGAVGSIVSIQDGTTTTKNAKVSATNRLLVDTEGSLTGNRLNVNTQGPGSEPLLIAFSPKGCDGLSGNVVITSVVVDSPAGGATDTALIAITDVVAGESTTIYHARADDGEHLDDTFDGGLHVGTAGAGCSGPLDAEFFIYGYRP